ncbi:hypothetical protein RUM44_006752 [Polyplax serrata]|uniref:POU domain protein n=1 Tax=Polyplax serrata TaxID=468196 RepID=A0ABR1AJ06_POLSC
MPDIPPGSEDSNPPSPDQYPGQREPTINGGMPSLDTKTSGDSPSTINSKNSLDVKTAEMVQHLLMMNGHHDNKMAALQSFQNLQNLATGLQNLNSVSSLVAGLQGLTGLQSMSTPLQNLTVPPQNLLNTPLNLSLGGTNSNGMLGNHSTPSPLLNPAQATQMPQLILASGQLVQGIQGAQLLIPTSQGIATQTILTIPVNHVTSNQMVNLALNNGQVITTTLAQLQSLTQPHLLSAPTSSPVGPSNNLLGLSGLPTHQQQILNAMQQQPQLVSHSFLNSLSTSNRNIKSPVHRTHHSYSSCDKLNNSNSPVVSSSSSNSCTSNGCTTSNTLTAISRLTANNTDITITPTPTPAHQMRTSDTESYRRERSESPLSETCDLLDDSPNEPMISEVQSNVVDGINLDEMKEFAKAFKLRRLSLGLTQTQVGQALSVTEGPAYSQSAICSALASRVLCAATRQQTIFEKLDITPKSAQKIKPVLERWMKEAEERFKSGQNHLTEFIGMEPSKKRKRRTSFTPQALELLNVHFERNTHPSGTEITALAHQLGYEREVIRIWFCNKRQALKNTVRMMSKGGG